ncbi:MAG: hypothetical protein BWK78_08930 [Thiotrichaceae bacterium IS1]|nr:MAG: hypothetical protein BWK78_08930 [Thiotrichaceae bacterium IS1]
MNVVLDVNIVLDLLLKRRPEYEAQSRCFSQLKQQAGMQLWFPVCALPTLDYVHQLEIKRLQQANQINSLLVPRQLSRQQLDIFMDSLNYASSLGVHVAMIPKTHPDREDALISLAAWELPGETVIWTNDKHFQSVVSQILVYDHIQLLNLIEPA